MNKSNDYHQYVFNDKGFVGDFENMYKNCEDPWGLDKNHDIQISYEIIASLIKFYRGLRNIQRPHIVEIGSGKGYFCNYINHLGDITGIDISETAVKISAEKYPDLKFINENIINIKTGSAHKYDMAVMFKGMIWYIIDEVDAALENIKSMLKCNGIVIIEVNYYNNDYYGKEIISCDENAIEIFSKYFKILNIINHRYRNEDINFEMCSYFVMEKISD